MAHQTIAEMMAMGISPSQARQNAVADFVVNQRPYVITATAGWYWGCWRDRYCDHLRLGCLKEELYGPYEGEDDLNWPTTRA